MDKYTEEINHSENSATKAYVPKIITVAAVRRREYGTPVDCIDIVQPPDAHPQTYFCDNSPSCSRNEPFFKDKNPSGNIDKKKMNRRKKRARQVNHKNGELKVPVQNDILDTLSQNLKDMLIPKINEGQIRNKKVESSILNVTTQNNSKPHSSKVFTNSKLSVQNMNNDNKSSTPSKKKINTPKNNLKREPKFNEHTPKRNRQSNVNSEEIKYEEYLSKDEVEQGLKTGVFFKSYLRINPKDCKTAYVASPNKTEHDIVIEGLQERNRALEGDLVVAKYKSEENWRSPLHKTGVIVHILEKIHPRTAIGVLKLMPDKNKEYACFSPRDTRIPRIKILFTDWPPLFYDNAEKFENTIFLAKIKEWPNSKYAIGTILENIGMSGDIKIETIAILKENCLDVTPYTDDLKKYFPSCGDISEEEYKVRLDLRKECIFTIDPLTARDLDDAVSCKELQNGNLEIGVHISDVTYYLKDNTPLNEIVSARATSTYMVESVYHMLPKELCMICSLLPGMDKLAFSVFWEMTPEGKIINHKFSRTIMNSCAQLAYEHAQLMLENPTHKFKDHELPEIYNGYTYNDLSKTVNHLHRIAVNLRNGRFEGGALRIDQQKLSFQIDPVSCLPVSYCVYENKESNRLIEEFMLLANITVATHLKEEYPDIAFLRSHPAPNEIMTNKLQTLLEKVGILLDVSSSGNLQKSLWSYTGDDEISQARMLVLCYLSAKTMTRAHYFCANKCDQVDEYWHYALNIPLYTHFTSPIRRYADIMVHRLLAASLGYCDKPSWEVDYVIDVAANCNKQKYNAKRAGEQSLDLYYIQYLAQNGPLIQQAIVSEVRETSFDVIILNSGVNCRVYLNVLPRKVRYQILDEDGKEIVPNSRKNGKENEEKKIDFSTDKKIKTLLLYWPDKNPKMPPQIQTIALFTIVTVKMAKNEKKLKIDAELLRPK